MRPNGIAAVLVWALVLPLPARAQAGSPADGASITIAGVPAITVNRPGTVTTAVKLRERPSTSAPIVEYWATTTQKEPELFLPVGVTLTVLARTVNKEKVGDWNNYWYRVEFATQKQGKVQAWACGEFIAMQTPAVDDAVASATSRSDVGLVVELPTPGNFTTSDFLRDTVIQNVGGRVLVTRWSDVRMSVAALTGSRDQPTVTKVAEIDWSPRYLDGYGDRMYVINTGSPWELVTLDLKTGRSVGRLRLADWVPSGISADAQYLFIAGGKEGSLLEVRRATDGGLLGTLRKGPDLTSDAFGIARTGALVALAAGEGLMDRDTAGRGILLVDVSDPRSPRRVGVLSTAGLEDARPLLFASTSSLVVSADGRLVFVDCADPRRPGIAHIEQTEATPGMAVLDRGVVYVSMRGGSYPHIVRVDASRPGRWVFLEPIGLTSNADSIAVEGGRLYAATLSWEPAVMVVDLGTLR